MVDRAVVAAVRAYLRAVQDQGLAVRAGVLFGSWARGTPGRWSDIDVIIISPRFDGPVRRDDIDLLWRVAARTDSRIEPVPCGERQWAEDDATPVIEAARREGHAVTLGE